jgi:GTP pyrophosphokinase
MATVNRVLPWRRHVAAPSDEVAPLVAIFQSHHPRSSPSLITRAYDRAAAAHEGQSRKSGEPYVTHPVAVAKICAELGLDDVSRKSLRHIEEDTAVGRTAAGLHLGVNCTRN